MKLFIPALLFSAISLCANAQITTTTPTRMVRFDIVGKDSVNLRLSENYEMIEDSCAVIIRRGHLNFATRQFKGRFKDVSKLDPKITLSEGEYTANGLKTGLFISHYLNGNLRSTGSYKNDKYIGKWEIYYDDGKPAMLFEARNDSIFLTDYWDKKGKKTIDKAKGNFEANLGGTTWKGKIENGKPDGTWHLFKTDDASERSIIDETFKKGVFVKGSSTFRNYTDSSRISFVDPDLLGFVNAEKLHVAPPCNGSGGKHIVNAQYDNGLSSFSIYIGDLAGPVLSKYNILTYTGRLTLTGDVSEKGNIENLQTPNPFNYDIAQGLSRAMRNLPLLHPATVNGKPVKQSFEIVFTFSNGLYHFSYRFLPIKA